MTLLSTRSAVVGLAAALTLATAACGSSTPNAPTSPGEASSAPSSAPTSEAPKEFTPEAAKEALLTQEELTGYTAQDISQADLEKGAEFSKMLKDMPIEPAECKELYLKNMSTQGKYDPSAMAARMFTAESQDLMVIETITRSPEGGTDPLAGGKEMMEKCPTMTIDIQGVKATITTKELPISVSAPHVAYLSVVEAAGQKNTSANVLVAQNDRVLMLNAQGTKDEAGVTSAIDDAATKAWEKAEPLF